MCLFVVLVVPRLCYWYRRHSSGCRCLVLC
uniref:Uncharacterized protein n=1 Tax=Arundo donax TaxID=35708 RepID=A0A0A9CCX2_ARUDO